MGSLTPALGFALFAVNAWKNADTERRGEIRWPEQTLKMRGDTGMQVPSVEPGYIRPATVLRSGFFIPAIAAIAPPCLALSHLAYCRFGCVDDYIFLYKEISYPPAARACRPARGGRQYCATCMDAGQDNKLDNYFMAQATQPKQVGRYQIIKLLGKGGQGAVYFAHDPKLQRPVALKTVRLDRQSPEAKEALLIEARTVSQVQHRNIVTLYDVIEQDDSLYLVFEYVEGQPLSQLLRGGQSLAPERAVEIALQVLDGLAYAHGKNIIHCDIKPANIMIDAQGVARIMDFGIARRSGDRSEPLNGTVAYMAPETIEGQAQGKAVDVFAMGMVLYEMLAGRPPVSGDNAFRLMHAIANERFQSPSALNHEVDEALDGIVMRALLKSPDDRYHNADDMRTALKQYAEPSSAEEEVVDASQSTLEFLLRRIRLKNDFPALSQSISAINKITNADSESLHALSAVILKDFSLTNKLLRLVNSAVYGHFGGTISTISRAVIILGFETVRNLAITLILFEHLQNKSQALQLRDEVIRTFFNGLVAKQIEHKLGGRGAEESFICAMFHNLGRLLAHFYLYDEAMEIRRRVQAEEMSEPSAEIAVLGLSYAELGMGIARAWNFPEKIVESMKPPADHVRAPQNQMERLRAVSGMANELTRIATASPPKEKANRLSALSRRFSSALPLSESELTRLVDESIKEFINEAALFGVNSSQSEALRNAREWAGLPTASRGASDEPADTIERQILETEAVAAELMQEPDRQDAKAVLSAGIQDITNSLVDNYNLNDLLRIILETMYRGMGFDRVLLCTRDVRSNALAARIGFGPNIDMILKRFVIPLGKSQDVFQVALDRQADIFLNDVNQENIRDRIPQWYKDALGAQTFILLPLIIDKKIIGLFYGDKARAGELHIPPAELNLLKTLRNQAVLAIRQKQMG